MMARPERIHLTSTALHAISRTLVSGICNICLQLQLNLTDYSGWDVKVVVPSSQKSWIGKAYQIKDITGGRYFYPRHPGMSCILTISIVGASDDHSPDGHGEISTVSRPVKRNEGEYAEWILLDGVSSNSPSRPAVQVS